MVGEMAIQCPTEIAISDRREKELSDLGFNALCWEKGTNHGVFFSCQTTVKPRIYNKSTATANARVAAMLSNRLNASMFAHSIHAMIRAKIGEPITKEELERYINNWLSDYIILNPTANKELRARYPLRGGRVEIKNIPDRPGYYCAVTYLQPHSQMEGVDLSLRIVDAIPLKN
jgi:type VI secretion system protein ImpC